MCLYHTYNCIILVSCVSVLELLAGGGNYLLYFIKAQPFCRKNMFEPSRIQE